MADYVFRCIRSLSIPDVNAQKYAVLRRLLGIKNNLPLVTVEDVESGVATILKRWRLRVVKLRDLKWRPADGVRFQYLRNCHPACGEFVNEYGGRSRHCTCSNICPWCWSRYYVYETFKHIGDVADKIEGDLHVFDFKLNSATDLPLESLFLDLDAGPRTTWAKLKIYGAVGMVSLWTIEPDARIGWRLSVRYLGLSDRPLAGIPGSKQSITTASLDRVSLSRALGRFAVYPRGMLYGNEESVLAILTHENKRHRRLRWFGALNSNTGKKYQGKKGSYWDKISGQESDN